MDPRRVDIVMLHFEKLLLLLWFFISICLATYATLSVCMSSLAFHEVVHQSAQVSRRHVGWKRELHSEHSGGEWCKIPPPSILIKHTIQQLPKCCCKQVVDLHIQPLPELLRYNYVTLRHMNQILKQPSRVNHLAY